MSKTRVELDRPVHEIAREIRADWQKVNYAAEPYLRAMSSLLEVEDGYGADRGADIIRYFLANATSWRGETARRIKAELLASVTGL